MITTSSLSRYRPLLALVLVGVLGGLAITLPRRDGMIAIMHAIMGFILCEFALLKLFDVHGFAAGFRKYDKLAQVIPAYALCYPFVELALGLFYLAGIVPLLTYSLTILVMGIGTGSVLLALKAGLDVRCACMGTALNVPLSTVTLIEDIGMGLMATLLLLIHIAGL